MKTILYWVSNKFLLLGFQNRRLFIQVFVCCFGSGFGVKIK